MLAIWHQINKFGLQVDANILPSFECDKFMSNEFLFRPMTFQESYFPIVS